MIEQLPEVKKLSPREKFLLASELWEELSTVPNAMEPDPAILRLLAQRYAEFKEGQHPTSSWEEIKKRLEKR